MCAQRQFCAAKYNMILEHETTAKDNVSSSSDRNERARLRRMHRRESSSPEEDSVGNSDSGSGSGSDDDTTTSYESDSDETETHDEELAVVFDTMKNVYERYGSMLHEAFGVMHKQLSVMQTVLTASAPSMLDLVVDKEQQPSTPMDTAANESSRSYDQSTD